MALWETMRAICGEILLFVFVASTVAAAAFLLDMLDSPTPKEGAIIATSFTIVAGMLYAARIGREKVEEIRGHNDASTNAGDTVNRQRSAHHRY